MKKINIILALAAISMVFSCTKESEFSSKQGERTISFSAISEPLSRTAFGTKDAEDKYPVLWETGDAIGVTVNKETSIKTAQIGEISEDHASAKFTYTTAISDGENQFFAVSPASAFKSMFIQGGNHRFNVEVLSGQTPTATGPDPAAQVLYASSEATSAKAGIPLSFHHIAGYLHFNVTGITLEDGETVSSVTVESATQDLAGRFFYVAETGEMSANSMVKAASVTTSSLSDIWMSLAPVDLSNQELTFIVGTSKGTYSKKVTFPSERNLTSGKVASFVLDMTGIAREGAVEYRLVTDASTLAAGDEIIIVAAEYDYALGTAQNANNRAAAGVTKDGDVILDPASTVETILLESGKTEGTFALATDKGYLTYVSGGNWLRTKSLLAENSSWTISIDTKEGKENIASITETSAARVMRFNTNNLFAVYDSNGSYAVETSGTKYVQIYKKTGTKSFVAAGFQRTDDMLNATGYAWKSGTMDSKLQVFANTAWSITVPEGLTATPSSGTGSEVVTITCSENTGSDYVSYDGISVEESALSIRQLPINSGVVLWKEGWDGAANSASLSDYSYGGTYVFGGGNVTYTTSATSYTYNTENATTVFFKSASEYDTNKGEGTPSYESLRLTKNSNMEVSGIPYLEGIAAGKLYYYANRNGSEYTATSSNVTLSNRSLQGGLFYKFPNGTSSEKEYNEYSYDISFDDNTPATFSIKFVDGHASNHIYLDDLKVEVTALK